MEALLGLGETRAGAAAPWVTWLSFAPAQGKGWAGEGKGSLLGLSLLGAVILWLNSTGLLFHLSLKFVGLGGVEYGKAT